MSDRSAQSPPVRRRKKRRWLLRLLLVGVGIAVAVVGYEVYLRYTMGALLGPAFDLRMYEVDDSGWPATTPNYEGQITMISGTTSVHLNSLGLRGAEVEARRPREKRILAAGDSMVFGMGVEMEDTFAYQMEVLLSRDLGRPFTVRIGAAPGYGTFDMARVVERVVKSFDPDLIVAGVYLGNDLEDNFQVSKTAVNGYFVFGPPARMADDSMRIRLRLAAQFRVWFTVEDFLSKHLPSWAIRLPDPGPEIAAFRDFPIDRRRGLFMDQVETTPGIVRILDRLEEGLRAVKSAAGSVPVVIVVIPTPPHCDEALYRLALEQQGRDPDEYAMGTLQRLVAERCVRVGLEVVDVTESLASLPNFRDGFLEKDDHLSPRGHAAVAASLAEYLAVRDW